MDVNQTNLTDGASQEISTSDIISEISLPDQFQEVASPRLLVEAALQNTQVLHSILVFTTVVMFQTHDVASSPVSLGEWQRNIDYHILECLMEWWSTI
jgi:hypothetical protein